MSDTPEREVQHIEYDRATMQLRVWLGQAEAPRTFYNVPPGMHEGLARTPEKQRFFETYIRENYASDD